MLSAGFDGTQRHPRERPGLWTLASLPPVSRQPLHLPLVTWSNLPAKMMSPSLLAGLVIQKAQCGRWKFHLLIQWSRCRDRQRKNSSKRPWLELQDEKHEFVGWKWTATMEESFPILFLCPCSTFCLWKKEYPMFPAESKNSTHAKGQSLAFQSCPQLALQVWPLSELFYSPVLSERCYCTRQDRQTIAVVQLCGWKMGFSSEATIRRTPASPHTLSTIRCCLANPTP